jgi:predicted transcriptional regulator
MFVLEGCKMAQLSLYISDDLARKLSEGAKARECSVSKYVVSMISDRLSGLEAENERKKRILLELWNNAEPDPTFVEPDEIPPEYEIPRRWDLFE